MRHWHIFLHEKYWDKFSTFPEALARAAVMASFEGHVNIHPVSCAIDTCVYKAWRMPQ